MNYKLSENVSLAPYCTMKVGGKAKFLAEPKTEAELISAISDFKSRGEKYLVTGNCSNLLFTDDGFDGAVITTVGVRGISVQGNIINALCGDSLSALARAAWENSLCGLEFCHGIPGTVGGGVFMNAGAYGGEICQSFVSGRFLDKNLNIITLNNSEMEFEYRKSRMSKEEMILLSAVFRAENGDKTEIRRKMDELMAKRRDKQPLEFPSCGSTFKRPEGYFAGALIEQCGLKGMKIGGAEVSQKHAGFIINSGNATAADVINLIKRVGEIVFENTGVRLEPEIRIIENY